MQVLFDTLKPYFSEIVRIGHLNIAYSGGLDSHVLLHLCSKIFPSKQVRLRAVHVHHGLQKEADTWVDHCSHITKDLAVDFEEIKVDATPSPGQSLEEAARDARYSALKRCLNKSNIVVTGQHREDQLETMLLQLFRGAGLAGLSGMSERSRLGEGWLIRPLLNVPKSLIEQYAKEHKLSWIEDPSNQYNQFDRNFLRNQVVPVIKQRWPSLDKTIARSARHCANAQTVIATEIRQHYQSIVATDRTLPITQLLAFDHAHKLGIVRYWFNECGLRMPSELMLNKIITEVANAKDDRNPIIKHQNHVVRRYRDNLYLLPETGCFDSKRVIHWPASSLKVNLVDNGALEKVTVSKSGIKFSTWDSARQIFIRYRQGGEKLSLPGRAGRHTLKNLYQEAGIPPWQRDRIPLLFFDDQLVAIGGDWICATVYDTNDGENIRLRWQPCLPESQ
ncbi:MAG: tRNA lysidine(34) synthetase TilS [Methylococcaceae bacterium]